MVFPKQGSWKAIEERTDGQQIKINGIRKSTRSLSSTNPFWIQTSQVIQCNVHFRFCTKPIRKKEFNTEKHAENQKHFKVDEIQSAFISL